MIIVAIFLLPFIINYIYSIDLHISFFKHSYERNQLLLFYSSFLSVLATLFLGGISVYQVLQNNKKSKEIDELKTEIANRYLSMIENNDNPQFSINLSSMGGLYSNLGITIQNVSKVIASEIEPIKFTITYDGNFKNYDVDQQTKNILGSKESLILKYKNIFTKEEENIVSFTLEFSCRNEKGRQYFFEAKKEVEISKNDLDQSQWEIECLKNQ